MSNYIYGRDKELSDWAASRIGVGRFREDARAMGLERNGKIVAVCVWDTFSAADCNIHVASDGVSRQWLTREFRIRAFYYPFVQCGLRRVTGLVPASNTAALRLNLHLGFTQEGVCLDALPHDDIVIMGMLRRHCPYIPPEYRHA